MISLFSNGTAIPLRMSLYQHRLRRAISLVLLMASVAALTAQNPSKNNPVKMSEDAKQATQKWSEDAAQTSANLQQAVQNIRESISVFEPILKLRLKKGEPTPATQVNPEVNTPEAPPYENTYNMGVTQEYIEQQLPVIPESPAYNSDGTANLGNQNNKKYGCYIDILNGAIMDEIDAAGNSRS